MKREKFCLLWIVIIWMMRHHMPLQGIFRAELLLTKSTVYKILKMNLYMIVQDSLSFKSLFTVHTNEIWYKIWFMFLHVGLQSAFSFIASITNGTSIIFLRLVFLHMILIMLLIGGVKLTCFTTIMYRWRDLLLLLLWWLCSLCSEYAQFRSLF